MYTKDNPLRVFEAFAGYGSQALALERLKQNFPGFDYKCVGFSEIEDAAIKAYNLLHPNVPNFGDITKIDWAQVSDFDLFTYSSPCTDFSQAGLQKGGEEGSGTRSSLLWECRRAIVAKKPKYLLLENVAALVSQKFLPLFNKWRTELASYGYNSFAQVLNAKNFGVPQNRERIFLVSIRDDGENPNYHFPEPFKLDRCLADVLDEDVEQKYFLKDEMVAKFLKANEKDPMVYVPTDHFLSDEEIEKAISEYDFESDRLERERECARSRRRVTRMLYLRTDIPFDGVKNSKPDIFLVSFNDGEDREICIDLWYIPLTQIYPAFCDIMRPYVKAVADAWDLYVTEASAKGLSPYTLNQLIGYEEHDWHE